jgi:hypothetical protein
VIEPKWQQIQADSYRHRAGFTVGGRIDLQDVAGERWRSLAETAFLQKEAKFVGSAASNNTGGPRRYWCATIGGILSSSGLEAGVFHRISRL